MFDLDALLLDRDADDIDGTVRNEESVDGERADKEARRYQHAPAGRAVDDLPQALEVCREPLDYRREFDDHGPR